MAWVRNGAEMTERKKDDPAGEGRDETARTADGEPLEDRGIADSAVSRDARDASGNEADS